MATQEIKKPDIGGTGRSPNLLDGLLKGLFGSGDRLETSAITPEQAMQNDREKDAKGDSAAAAAYSAWKNPGASYISGAEAASGAGKLDIGSIIKSLFSGGGTL
jgi:hypothetical protein